MLYCDPNTPFTAAARNRLRDHHIDRVYVRQGDRNQYCEYLGGHLESLLGDQSIEVKEKAHILYDSAQAVVAEVLEDPTSRERIQRGRDVVRHTVDFMTSDDFLLEHLLRTISCDYYHYTHAVNVVAYSVALAMHLGFKDQPTLRELANGALLHDVGKSKIPDAILNKDAPLTAEEWKQMQAHPLVGHDMLAKETLLGEIALDIVLHHHERLDGNGYPHGLKGDQIAPFTRIAAIADTFDALTSERHHQKGQSTFQALTIMYRDGRHDYDLRYLKQFIEMMGADSV